VKTRLWEEWDMKEHACAFVDEETNTKLEAVRFRLQNALRVMGTKYLKPQYRSHWTPDRPTTGYCYIVSEIIHHFLLNGQSKPHLIRLESGGTHWFLKLPIGQIVDWTADQFDRPIPYGRAKPAGFLTKTPSKRSLVLASLLGLTQT